jgi:hypothetical protein
MIGMNVLPLVGHTRTPTQTQLYKAKREEIFQNDITIKYFTLKKDTFL